MLVHTHTHPHTLTPSHSPQVFSDVCASGPGEKVAVQLIATNKVKQKYWYIDGFNKVSR